MRINSVGGPTGSTGPEPTSELKAGHGKTKAHVQHLANQVNDLNKSFAKTSTDEKLGTNHVITQGPIRKQSNH